METKTHEQTQAHYLTHRVITLLDRRQMDFLDKLGKDSLFSTGHKLSYNEILKGLIDLALELNLSGEGISSVQMLKEKILQSISRKKECAPEKKD